MKLNLCAKAGIVASFLVMQLQTAPLIQRIVNNSDIGFVIFEHSDTSSCSLANKHMMVHARSDFKQEFLLELGKPSVVLRPIYYLDPISKKTIEFVDDAYQVIPEKLKQAYDLWKLDKHHKKFVTPQAWLSNWVGLDISVVPHEVEIFGYLVNLSRVMIKNNKHQQVQWLSFSKGIFSQLVVELELNQRRFGKGIKPNMKLFHGEGGVCSNGVVEKLH